MKIKGTHYRSLWWNHDDDVLEIIDQRSLPYEFIIQQVPTMRDFEDAIVEMRVRGAPLIGATAAYGMALAMKFDPSDANIGENGLQLIRDIAIKKPKGQPVQVLTHCNAGWIATVDWGTATSPMYQAHDAEIPIHVWVDETRPRNQGALTSWELGNHGVPHTYVTDNAGGHLMQQGMVDMVIVGTDRTTRRGDVCNKIGTYLKALAAHDNGVPFYVALPSPTIDWTITDGVAEIPIEERDARETTHIQGTRKNGTLGEVQVTPEGTPGGNPAFDVTPNRLVTGLITEKGICNASEEGLSGLFPEMAAVVK